MKNNKKLLLLTLLGTGLLSACGGVVVSSSSTSVSSSVSSSDSTSVSSDTPSSSEESTCPTPEKTEFAINYQAAAGSKVEILTAKGEEGYKAGSTIEFKVTLSSTQYELVSVKVDDTTLIGTETYTFTMPNRDVNITTETKVLGGNDILNQTKFTTETFEALPSDVSTLNTFLEGSKTANSKYFKEGSFKQTSSDPVDYDDLYDVNIKAGNNEVLLIDGFYGSNNDEIRSTYHQERGIEGDRYYELTKTTTEGNESEKIKILKTTTDEDAKNNEINLNDADLNVKFFDVFSLLSSEYFANSSYDWAKATVEKTLSEDNLYATFTINEAKASTSSYSDGNVIEAKIVVDGDNFVSKVDIVEKQYEYASYVDGVLSEDAIPSLTKTFVYTATRGYKSTIVTSTDLNDYVSSDYDLVTKSYVGSKSFYAENGGETYVGSVLSFLFKNKDNDSTQIVPTLVGCNEGEEQIVDTTSSSIKVLKEGTFHLTFDNGLGETKTFEFNAVLPAAQSISANTNKTQIFVGDTATIEASISPAEAVQTCEVTKLSDSANCEIVDNQDGTFTVKGLEEGTIKLSVACKENPTLSKEVTITVVAKPSYDAVYETITTKTLHYKKSYYDEYAINFNADGSGKLYDLYSDNYSTFTYALDSETLAFTITQTDEGTGDTILKSIEVITATEFSVTYSYFGRDTTITMEAIDRTEY